MRGDGRMCGREFFFFFSLIIYYDGFRLAGYFRVGVGGRFKMERVRYLSYVIKGAKSVVIF